MPKWHDLIAEHAILDRIVHKTHRILLTGDSLRKQKTVPLLTGTENNEINHL